MTQILAMLIDVHAHFYHAATPRADWRERNASRFAAGRKIGVTIHVASILGSWGRTSPIYFPSPQDVEAGNSALLALEREHPHLIRGYVTVNPNYTSQARAEIGRCLGAGMVGIKLAASRGATGRGRRRRTDQSSPPWLRATRRCDSSWRTSAGAATGNTPSPPCAPRPTCTWICRGAVWTAACSKRASKPPARSDCSGERTSRSTPAGRSCVIWSACCRRASWSSYGGETRHASSRAARSPPTDAHRRQRLPRRVSAPAGTRDLARRPASRHGPRRDRRGVGEPHAEPVLASADGGERLVVRHRGARAAAQTRAGAPSRALGVG